MTTINNLTIEQMREIVEGAPDEASFYQNTGDQVGYILDGGGIYWWWNSQDNSWNKDYSDVRTMRSLKDLRTAIAEHDTTDIGTEIDSFLDAFKSPELTDDRKEELTQDWKGMSGGVAFSLIERHADNWKEIDYMMNQWLEANKEAERHG
ncbi:MAG: hypothetical protein I4N51_09035 [Acinetobacter sp.]|nr:hypothetical protein [Acinetobacter sp.]